MTDKTQEQTEEKVNISMQDIALAYRAIELAQSRGAFKLDEAATVGTLGTKMKTFLDQNAPKEEDSEEKDSEKSE